MPIKVEITKISEPADLEKAFAIRHQVFVKELNCPAELERENEDVSTHFLATVDGEPAGTARWRKTDKGYKLERFAVLSKFRGGVGSELLRAVLADLPANAGYIYLHAQTPAVTLYEKFGFEKHGREFEEAGIKHFKMVKAG